jgi:hypothetical protein
MATVKKNEQILSVPMEREKMHLLLLQNPNYFGTLSEKHPNFKDYKAVKAMNGNTTYEQVTCVGYNPQMKTLTAIVKISQNGGYNGGPCVAGSKEYVRFYIDYQRNGTWVDLGMISFDAHDFNHSGNNPLCYAVNLAFEPAVTHCCDDKPVLPIVRAILSWSVPPTPNTPNYPPVWGNHLNVNVQMAPKKSWTCWLKHSLADLNLTIKAEQLKLLAAKMADLPPAVNLHPEELNLSSLVKKYGKSAEPERIGFGSVVQALKAGAPTASLAAGFKYAGIDISKVIGFILQPKFNTTYEEVKCVGLNRDTSRLYATVNVKQSYGYSGSLCDPGSREYIGFYMDFGSGWEFMGTSSVETHDIDPMPSGGLCYHVELPVNLTPHQKLKCSQTYFAKVRAILSWNMYPPDNQPDWIAPWGDREDAWVEIRQRQGTQGNPTGKKPIITTIGSIPSKKISKITGMVDSSLDAPDAAIDGYNGFSFNGTIPITGLIPEHPDSNDMSSAQLQYKIMLKKASQPDTSFAPVANSFAVLKNVISGGILDQHVITQAPVADMYNYLVDYNLPTIVTVHGDLFGVITVADSDVYEFYLETSEGYQSERCRIKVDKNAPKDVHIKVNGSEDCGTLLKGMDITGTYSLADNENNCHSVSFEFITLRAGDSTDFTVDGNPASFGSHIPMPGAGRTGIWSMTTNNVRKCGYNIRLHAWDKTLYCYPFVAYAYAFTQQYSSDTIGFCLNEA